ncbi:MAG: lipoprotein [Steroidobacteraceae bacterium]
MLIVRVLIVLSLTATAWGCGQKGPLVLPDAQHPHKKLTIPAPPKPPAAPASVPSPTPASPTPASPTPPSQAVPSPAVPTSPDGNSTPAPAPQR